MLLVYKSFLKDLEAVLEAAEVKKGGKREEKKNIAVVGDRTRDLSHKKQTR